MSRNSNSYQILVGAPPWLCVIRCACLSQARPSWRLAATRGFQASTIAKKASLCGLHPRPSGVFDYRTPFDDSAAGQFRIALAPAQGISGAHFSGRAGQFCVADLRSSSALSGITAGPMDATHVLTILAFVCSFVMLAKELLAKHGLQFRSRRDAAVQTESFANVVMGEVIDRERILMTKTVESLKEMCCLAGVNPGRNAVKPLLARALAATFLDELV